MSKFSDATLYLAPSGYKEGILFPQKPLSTNGEISFTRASSAWRTNIEGQLEEVCYNLLQQSEDFSNVYWSKTNITVTTNSVPAPDGTLTADTITKTSTDANIFQSVSQIVGNSYTYSVYLRADVAGTIVFGTSSGATFQAINITTSWQRYTFTRVNSVASDGLAIFFTASTLSSIYIWGAQLVQGSLPRPYLSTTNRQNFPRVDYSLGTGTFLLEPQRTNIHLASTSMYNMATFGATAPTLTQATTVLDPSAGYNAALVTGGSGSSGTFGIYNIIPTVVTSGQVVVVSCYVKAGTHDKVMLQNANVTVTGGSQAYFDLATGTTPTSGASIQAVGNGWYRCIIQPVTFTANSNITSYNIGCYVTPSTSTNTWSSDFTGKSVYFYGIQVEVGSFATSLIPTTSSAVTRIADSFSRGKIFTNNLISSSGGTWFLELRNNIAMPRVSGYPTLFISSNTAGSSTLTFGLASVSSASRFFLYSWISGTFTNIGTTPTDNIKVAFAFTTTTLKVFVNGSLFASYTGLTIDPTTIQNLIGYSEVTMFIQQMALWRTPLTDAQCQEITL